VLTNTKHCFNSTWDNEWTLQSAHNTLCLVGYDIGVYIAPMPHAYTKEAIDITMKYMQVYAPCIG
jgi:hypothetical protein